MSLLEFWEATVSKTLLGSRRDGALANLPIPWSGLENPAQGGESRILTQLAVLATAVRAGQAALPTASLGGGPLDDARPEASSAAEALLEAILADRSRDLLEEWLGLCAISGCRPPPGRLPELLDLALENLGFRPATKAACGPGTSWLAAMDKKWSRLTDVRGTAGERWETGSPADRLQALVELRSQSPAAARQLLEAVWKSETAEVRAQLLGALETGLGSEDETFLEGCLDDRSKLVQRASQPLLARLPGSAFSRRFGLRLVGCLPVAVTAGFLGLGKRKVVGVELPTAEDAELGRDVVDLKPAKGVGERVHLLTQVVAWAPLEAWKALADSPAEVVALLEKSEHAAALGLGLTRAVEREGSVVWAQALLRESMPGIQPNPLILMAARAGGMVSLAVDPASLSLLAGEEGTWSPSYSELVLGHFLKVHFEHATFRQWPAASFVSIAQRANLEVAKNWLPRLRKAQETPPIPMLTTLVQRIESRITLHQAFAKGDT